MEKTWDLECNPDLGKTIAVSLSGEDLAVATQYIYLHFTLSFTVADLKTLQLMVPDRGRKKMVTFNANYSVGWLNDKVHVRIELQLVVIARLVMLINSELKNLQIAHIRCFEPQKQ